MDLLVAKEWNQNLISILPEVELLIDQIDRKVKELAEQYLNSSNKKEDERILDQAKHFLSLNQVLSMMAMVMRKHPDYRKGIFESLIKDVNEYYNVEIYLDSNSFEYLAFLHSVAMFYWDKDIFSEEAYFPPITKDTLETLKKTLKVEGLNELHNTNLFKQEKRWFKEKIHETTIAVMEKFIASIDPKQFSQEQIFCYYITTLMKKMCFDTIFSQGIEWKVDLSIDLSIGQLKQIIALIRACFHEILDKRS